MKVIENSPQNARNYTIFKNFLGGVCPQTPLPKARLRYATQATPPPPKKNCWPPVGKGSVKRFMFTYNFLRGFFTMRVVENRPQNARNCTIFKNFLGGACPQTPLVKALLCGMYIQNPKKF